MPKKNSSKKTPRRGNFVSYIKQAFVQFPLNQHNSTLWLLMNWDTFPSLRLVLLGSST